MTKDFRDGMHFAAKEISHYIENLYYSTDKTFQEFRFNNGSKGVMERILKYINNVYLEGE